VVSRYRFHLIAILLAFSHVGFAQDGYDLKKCDSAPLIAWSQAEKEAVERGEVEIPPLAKAVRVQGVVRIELCVSEAGKVVLAKFVSGHPILVGAALESAKKWRFNSGRTAPFKTVLEVSFSQGGSNVQLAEEQRINGRFFEEDRKCRETYHSKDYTQALPLCQGALDLAKQLPNERANERRGAYEILGHVYFSESKFEEALQNYHEELQIALDSLKPYEAELAYAYHDMALACHALGKTSDAAQYYSKAEQTILQARDHIGFDELKTRYSATLNQIREHYLILLQQTGQTAAADDLEKRMHTEHK